MATTAGEALLAYLEQQLAELRQHAPGVLEKQPESVHQMRVAARRFRSLLASGRPLFDDGTVEPLRAELRWLSGLLGAARDPGVAHERLTTLLAEEPESLRGLSGPHSPAAHRIDEELDALANAGFEAVLEALGDERYAQLLADLERFLADPALSAKAAGAPGPAFGGLVAKDRRRLRRAVKVLPDAKRGHAARDAALHEVRKAAKRLRYSAELAAAVPGAGGAKRLAKSARKIQQVLGLHQDSVVARKLLAELGGGALGRGESGFSYGRLHAKEEILAAASERAFFKIWKKFPAS